MENPQISSWLNISEVSQPWYGMENDARANIRNNDFSSKKFWENISIIKPSMISTSFIFSRSIEELEEENDDDIDTASQIYFMEIGKAKMNRDGTTQVTYEKTWECKFSE